MARRILVIDDEENIRKMLQGLLEDEGYEVAVAASAEEGAAILRESAPDAFFLDVQLPGMDGVSFLESLGAGNFPAAIVMSGHATIDMAVRATRVGAFDFLEKPLDPERLLLTLRNALRVGALERENADLRRAAEVAREMVGNSAAMQKLREEIAYAAPSPARVLITGENGTGKELVARAIHEESPRAGGPFIKVNCAAIPKDLIESELFGHEKGAFTGASQQRIGKIEQAEGGTLLLDEIGDMSLETQAKLLRVLEANELERVGGRKTIPFDVRVLSATNKVLPDEIGAGRFREDLYYRIAVVPIEVPPLRDRIEDIADLARHFERLFSEESGRLAKPFSSDAIARLESHDWPGNIRELRNVVERLQIMSRRETIEGDEVHQALATARSGATPGGEPERQTARDTSALSFRDRVERFEIDLIEATLRRHGGNVAETARALDTDRANLHRKMKRYGIRAKEKN
ncbi:MAG: sigma-54-dependent Fis family transcriptional regulator [Gemmatimonadetes bacterium]|nr:sigma-54-dependent Fis family transcriptional regulator [Gemmatimonadota bacterium]